MFIKTAKRKKLNGKTYYTHYLAQSYRDKLSGMPKHKYISNLSHLPEKLILVLKTALRGNVSEIEKINLDSLEVLSSKEYGSVKVFQKLFQETFGKYFKKCEYRRALESIVINKIFDSKSKHSLKAWIAKSDFGYKISNKNDLYESLDYVESLRERIEKDLHTKDTGSNILLYDITSTYFEGKGAENICKYGYSRDHRRDKVQVNIGVITNSHGSPMSVEVIAGNISDKETLEDQIQKLKKKFNIKKITFVFDRGMKSTVNLERLQEEGYDYITALTHAELRKKCLENKECQMSLFDKKDLAEFEIEDKNYSLVHNPLKAKKDKSVRDVLIKKTEEKLDKIKNLKRKYTKLDLQDKISKVINKYHCEKYITYSFNEYKEGEKEYALFNYKLNTNKIEENEKYDGFYMVESTNKKKKGENLISQYKDLQLVERAFDSVKNHIKIRPVFHYKETRIKGHIFTCFMSYLLLHKFKQKLQDLLKEHTLDELLTELTMVHRCYIKVQRHYFSKITNLSELAKNILQRFNITSVVT